MCKKTMEGHFILKIRPTFLAQPMWTEVFPVITAHALKYKGEPIVHEQPPQKIIKKMLARHNRYASASTG
jgi:hypothetical protein